jgi:branched-chain amino acid transport system permease protein
MNVFLILFVAGSVSGIISLSLGFPALRVKGLYLALITMGFCICMDILIIYFEKITGGSTGIPTPNPTILGVKFDTDIKKYYLIYSFVILATIIGRLILDSKIGRAFFGIRDSDIAAETNGVNMILYRNLAFIIGCFYAGVAGALYAINFNYIEPKSFDIEASVYYLVVLIIGGYGNIYGALIGSLTIGWLMDFFKQLQGFVRIKGADELRVILYGLVILIFIVFEPNGCYGRWRVIRAYFKAFPLNETHRKRIAWIRRWK